jgi:hypothetical protein
MMAGGGGLVVVASVLGGVALSKAKGADFRTGGDASSAQGLARAADVLGAVGLAAAAGGLVWWLVTRESGDDPDEAPADQAQARFRAAPVIGPGTAGAAAWVTF